MAFADRFYAIVGPDYDMDRDPLSIDQTNQLLALINSMPTNNRVGEEDLSKQVFQAEGWSEEEAVYIELTINRVQGVGFWAGLATENMMAGANW
ncbi:hypothetical protein B9J07_27785 [Sinorhizobium sp. LM21]|uniref:hypothetical protein n=1 Tax=Sinorhizobium sp. LM21 TaxID=1449788 RepID=UPI0005D9FFEB|nr:hypothetical protein [Sinorhizobium sp. LM21]AJW30205.1 hypothetical protein pLM21S1_p85 [Sinorhizobium sp. LM21]OWZ90391.1 hypothetical protein B9J07_27785 [Sinorhizobium sp. LM21]